jgi:hypothetical protein
MEQETDEGQEMQRSQSRGEALIVARESAEACGPGKVALHHPASREEDEAPLGLGQLDHCQLDAVLCGRLSRLWAGVALIDVRQLHMLARHLLYGAGQLLDLRPLLFIGRRHQQRQEMAQGIDRDMDLRPLSALVPIVASTRAALRGRLDRARIQDGGRWWLRTLRRAAQQDAQIVDDRLKAAPAAIQRRICW